ncbi:apyrase-like [Uranotaenia lowii]|uniref:apyrase-like n=1 Tax=Uranotaenia lowii TaxID=190385 RepID=UPI0024799173|nr:apyrase-like [Uranotaenia lowii]
MRVNCVLFLLLLAGVAVSGQGNLYELSIIHINDFHARFEEVNTASTSCNRAAGDVCVGGYARTVTVVKDLLTKRTNPLYLNAGDNFQGTLWYNIHRWNATVEFLNMLPADAMTIGNHEFDHGVEGVVPFLNNINSPVLLVNVDNSKEPEFKKFQKSMIIERNGRKIGIIGVILKTTDNIANTGDLRFADETQTVRAEAEALKEQGANIIIVLSHCGLDVDEIIAAGAGPDIDIIVGGHSHTFLYTGDHPSIPGVAQGEYPTIVTQPGNGHKVLIVQAAAYTKFVGDIRLFFDDAGIIQRWEGNPVYLGHDVVPDPDIVQALIPWKEAVDIQGNRRIGNSTVDLLKSNCNYGECNLGSFIADSMVAAFIPAAEPGHWTYAAVAVVAVGGIRVSMFKGDLNFKNLIEVLPFENSLVCVDLRGDQLLAVLEYSVEKSWDVDKFNGANMLQVAGLRVEYNVTNPIGNRVTAVHVRCYDCQVPRYDDLKPLKFYRVVTNSFIAGGGDGFEVFPRFGRNKRIGPVDVQAFEDYIASKSPIIQGIEGRIKVHT